MAALSRGDRNHGQFNASTRRTDRGLCSYALHWMIDSANAQQNYFCTTVNEAQQMLFTHNLRNLECVPPTKAALYQHVKRAVFVSVSIWHGSLARELRLPAPADYGWEWNTRTKGWVPSWTHLKDASIACPLLLHCSCNKACKGMCKCYKGGLRCTPLSKCQGGCCNNQKWNSWSVIHINKEFKTLLMSQYIFIWNVFRNLEYCTDSDDGWLDKTTLHGWERQ